ncbi:MAG TPA: patatin-like phospholipase family protein [Acidimicrobiales bacterium]|nr:patatin-like phospholipase family protein [Acidimicrobiales bacterium]
MAAADDRPRTAAVVLGSGGARGYAHIGALQVILDRGFEIVALAGSSMGALVAGVHAAGCLDEYTAWVTGLRQLDVLRLVDLSLSAGGAIRGEKVFSIVREMVGDMRIEDLPVAYTAVATDVLSHREVWFQEGRLADAIRASVAIPSLFTPVVSGDQLLVDGALMNPVPILPTLPAHADITIAVSLSGEVRRHSPTRASGPVTAPVLDEPGPAVDGPPSTTDPVTLRRRAARFFDWEAVRAMLARADRTTPAAPAPGVDVADVGRLEIVNMAYEVMQATLTSYKLAGYPPDVLVEIPKASARMFEFHRAPELIALGRASTEAALTEAGL